MAINREDGVIYFGDMNISSCDLTYYNLETMEKIFQIELDSSKSNVSYDGNFIHYNNSIYTKKGIVESLTSQAREYKNIKDIKNLKTVFDNNSISIFTGVLNDEFVTVVYNLSTNTHLYTIKANAVNANIKEGKIIIFDNYERIIQFNLE
jgi:hypothetical protein